MGRPTPGGEAGATPELRIFLAVFPTPEAQGLVAEAIERLRRPGDRVSWVQRENLHYTVRFLGALGEDGARRAFEAAREAAREHAPFEAALGALGAFPGPRRARVLWVGLSEGAEPLVALAKSVEASLRRRGFERADHSFAPHLTIGRVREPGEDWSATLEQAADRLRGGDAEGRFRVDRIAVVNSRLSPKGSVYTVRAEAPLGQEREGAAP